MRKVLLAGLTAFAMMFSIPTGVIATTVTPKTPFQTSTRPYLVGLQPGVDIVPLISAGDVIGGRLGGFQFTGVPDGIGTYASSPNRLEVFMNHEMSYRYGDPPSSRVSHLTLNRRWSSRPATRWMVPRDTNTSARRRWTRSGGALVLHGRGVDRLAKGGMSVAINALTGRRRDPAFRCAQPRERRAGEGAGQGSDAPVGRLVPAAVQAYATSPTASPGLSRGRALHRVGARRRPDRSRPLDRRHRQGRDAHRQFVTIPTSSGTTDGTQCDSRSAGFVQLRSDRRLGDRPLQPRCRVLRGHGPEHRRVRYGRVYHAYARSPRRATLEVVLDSAVDDIANPDGMGINSTPRDPGGPQQGVHRLQSGARLRPVVGDTHDGRSARAIEVAMKRAEAGARGVQRRRGRERVLRRRHVAHGRAGSQDEHPPARTQPEDRLSEGERGQLHS